MKSFEVQRAAAEEVKAATEVLNTALAKAAVLGIAAHVSQCNKFTSNYTQAESPGEHRSFSGVYASMTIQL